MRVLSSVYLTTSSVLFLALFVLNAFAWEATWLGVLLFVFFFVRYGKLVGARLSPNEPSAHWWLGSFAILSIVALVGSLFYYVWSIPAALFPLLTLILVGIAHRKQNHRIRNPFKRAHKLLVEKHHKLRSTSLLPATFILLLGFFFFLSITDAQILDAVRSPWERIDASVFFLVGFALLLLFGLLMRGKDKALVLALTSFLLFAFLSVAAIAYPIGFGFDTFIHSATTEHLAEFGTITPKPFYYIGQYSITLFLHHAFTIPLSTINTFLVPVLAALFLPFAWFFASAHVMKKKRDAMGTLMILFLMPLSMFILSTPQALANLWTLLVILLSIPLILNKTPFPRSALLLPAIAALVIHPIAGIPIVLYTALLFLTPDAAPKKLQAKARPLFWIIAGLSAVILPLSFAVLSLLSGDGLSLGASGFALSELVNFSFFFENRFNPLLDFIYLYGFNAILILLAIAAFAWFEYKRDLPKTFWVPTIMAGALFVNYLLMKTVVDFSFLIDYERLNYANRLVPLILFFLAPLILLGFGHVVMNIRSKPVAMKAFVVVLLMAFSTSAFYLAYPRRDAYETSHGFNVSQADVNTVHAIEAWAEDEPYVVLANQSVSAAAISEIGFRYYSDLFFYPIPTGGDLYQKFLEMNDRPTREKAQEALDLVPMHGDVQSLYYVVNNYWWQAPRIIETAKTTANEWRMIDGVVFVAKYNFKP